MTFGALAKRWEKGFICQLIVNKRRFVPILGKGVMVSPVPCASRASQAVRAEGSSSPCVIPADPLFTALQNVNSDLPWTLFTSLGLSPAQRPAAPSFSLSFPCCVWHSHWQHKTPEVPWKLRCCLTAPFIPSELDEL